MEVIPSWTIVEEVAPVVGAKMAALGTTMAETAVTLASSRRRIIRAPVAVLLRDIISSSSNRATGSVERKGRRHPSFLTVPAEAAEHREEEDAV